MYDFSLFIFTRTHSELSFVLIFKTDIFDVICRLLTKKSMHTVEDIKLGMKQIQKLGPKIVSVSSANVDGKLVAFVDSAIGKMKCSKTIFQTSPNREQKSESS